MKLRPYQRDALAAVEAHLGRACIVAHATGLGKTVLAGAWLAMKLKHGERALFLAHRDELIRQARDQLGRWLAPDCIGIVAGEQNETHASIVVASIQTLAKAPRLRALLDHGGFSYVVQDECHHGAAVSYQEIYRTLGIGTEHGPFVLGLSATPHRHDGKALDWPVVHEITLKDGIARGYLADIQTETVSMDGDWQARVRRGDFDVTDLERSLLEGDGPRVIADTLALHGDKQSLVFTPTVKTAETVAAACQSAGLTSMAIHGLMSPLLRVNSIGSFREGRTRVLTNCAVLTEGFDEPSIACLVLARPTRSRSLFLQMLGRGTRKHPGKDHLLVIDLAGASERHDLVTVADAVDLPCKQLPPGTRVGEILASKKIAGVDLAEMRPYAWVHTAVGYALGLGQEHGTLLLREHPGTGQHMLYHLKRGTRHAFVAAALDLEDGQHAAESLAVDLGVSRLVRKDEGWRAARASMGQRAALEKFRLPTHLDMSRGRAADLLTRAIVEMTWRKG